MSRTIKISYSVESVVTLEEHGEAHLIDVYARVKSGECPMDLAPVGFATAAALLGADASRDTILATIIGEVTAAIIENEIPQFYPAERHGFGVRIAQVAYQESPEALPLPEGAKPLVITPSSRTVH